MKTAMDFRSCGMDFGCSVLAKDTFLVISLDDVWSAFEVDNFPQNGRATITET